MIERFEIEFKEGGVDLTEAILTGGAAVVVEKSLDALTGDTNHGWYCTIKDKVTGLKKTQWGVSKEEAHDRAHRSLILAIENFEEEQIRQQREIKQKRIEEEERRIREEEYRSVQGKQAQHESPSETTEQAIMGLVLKLVLIIAAVFAVIWFVFSVAIPLIVINISAIALIAGLASKSGSKFLFPVSFLGAAFLIIDINMGWFTVALVKNVVFFKGIIPFFYYINIVSGLSATYFLIRNFLNEKRPPDLNQGEFSRRNLITMGCLLIIGGLTIGLQKHFDSNNIQSIQSQEIINSREDSSLANPLLNSESTTSVNEIINEIKGMKYIHHIKRGGVKPKPG